MYRRAGSGPYDRAGDRDMGAAAGPGARTVVVGTMAPTTPLWQREGMVDDTIPRPAIV